MTESQDDSLGHRIRCLRKERKLTQADLANGVCSKAFVSQVERNQCQPSLKTLSHFARRLGVDVSVLIGTVAKEPLPEWIAEKDEHLTDEAGNHIEMKTFGPANSKEIDHIVDFVSQLPVMQRIMFTIRILETITSKDGPD